MRERLLGDVDAWESGERASAARPMDGEPYALEMRENRKRLLAELDDHARDCVRCGGGL